MLPYATMPAKWYYLCTQMLATYLNLTAKAAWGDTTSSLTMTAMPQTMELSSPWQQSSDMLCPPHLKLNLQASFAIVKMLCHCGKHARKWVTTSLKLLLQLITPWHMASLLSQWLWKHQKPWTCGSTGSNDTKPSNNSISHGKRDQQTLLTTALNIIPLNTRREFAAHMFWTTLLLLNHTCVLFLQGCVRIIWHNIYKFYL